MTWTIPGTIDFAMEHQRHSLCAQFAPFDVGMQHDERMTYDQQQTQRLDHISTPVSVAALTPKRNGGTSLHPLPLRGAGGQR